jgi:hypothetical protein
MSFALVIFGLLMIVTGARDTYKQFGSQITQDFVTQGGFLYWVAAIGAVGALGYVPSLRAFSRVFMGLIIVAMVLKNGGFFNKLQEALKQGPTNIQADTLSQTAAANSSSTGFDGSNYGMSDLLQGKSPGVPSPGDLLNGFSNIMKYLEIGHGNIIGAK